MIIIKFRSYKFDNVNPLPFINEKILIDKCDSSKAWEKYCRLQKDNFEDKKTLLEQQKIKSK